VAACLDADQDGDESRRGDHYDLNMLSQSFAAGKLDRVRADFYKPYAAQPVGRHEIGHHENEKNAAERHAEFDPRHEYRSENRLVSDALKP